MIKLKLITKFFTILITFQTIFFNLKCSDIILLIGASCSGKSTISEALHKRLNEEKKIWEIVGFDECGENIENLIEFSKNIIKGGENIVIDTNTYEETIDEELNDKKNNLIKIYVYAPLDILLKRDEERNEKRERSEERALRARRFVKISFENTKSLDVDFKIDTSINNVNVCVDSILNFYKEKIIKK